MGTVATAVAAYVLLVVAAQAALVLAGVVELRQDARRRGPFEPARLVSSRRLPRISVLAPAYAEQATIVASATALLTLRYPDLEVVVVVDGSPDGTLQVLTEAFALEPVAPAFRRALPTARIRQVLRSAEHPRLVVIDKDNGGKADALNAGLDVSSGELVCAVDADTLIERDALLRMVRPFLLEDGCVAVGGTIRTANATRVQHGRVVRESVSRRLLSGVQAVEYLRAFLFGRLGWNRLGGNLLVSGAFGLFRRDALLAADGWSPDTIVEDFDLVARLRHAAVAAGEPGRVTFLPDPVAWTEVPTTVAALGRQRVRWHRGLTDVLLRNRRRVGDRRLGALGLVVWPYFLLVELLAPVVETVGLVLVAVLLATDPASAKPALAMVLLAYSLGVLTSALAVLADALAAPTQLSLGSRLRLLLWALVEPVGVRQLHLWWRLKGVVLQLRGGTAAWGAMPRAGFGG